MRIPRPTCERDLLVSGSVQVRGAAVEEAEEVMDKMVHGGDCQCQSLKGALLGNSFEAHGVDMLGLNSEFFHPSLAVDFQEEVRNEYGSHWQIGDLEG